ncbi:hypothetical protein MMC16_006467 [Acarospora aff. strigata]|nr:hypothetical protein [Acarospora aff. strigata]
MDQPNGDPSNTKSSSTQTHDLICEDWQYSGANATGAGRKWKECIECESSSSRFDLPSGENDVYWFLFNIKFTVDWCIFGYPSNPDTTAASTTCGDACNNLKPMTTYQLLQTDMSLQYSYCRYGNGSFLADVANCTKCLANVPGAQVLSNYLHAMSDGCQQQPGNGTALKLDFDLFNTTSPLTTKTTSTTSPASTSTVMPTSASASTTTQPTRSNTSVKIGAGVGVPLGVVLAALVFGLLMLRSRRNRRPEPAEIDDTKGLPPPVPPEPMSEMGVGTKNLSRPHDKAVEVGNGDPRHELSI